MTVCGAAPDVRDRLGDEAHAALRALGASAVAVRDLSRTAYRSPTRVTFAVTLDDGRTVKVRRYTRPARSRRAARLLAALGDRRLPRVLSFRGNVRIEEWIDGAALAASAARSDLVERAADLLASLHAVRAVDGQALLTERATAPLYRRMARQLASLTSSGLVTPAERQATLEVAATRAPAVARYGLTHDDFCAENLVEAASGELVVIDNEHLRFGFLDYDLARTWYRWPMSERTWRRFAERYAARRSDAVDPARSTFWRIAAVIYGAQVRLVRRERSAIDEPLARLRELLASSR